jgi:hypothetical protein
MFTPSLGRQPLASCRQNPRRSPKAAGRHQPLTDARRGEAPGALCAVLGLSSWCYDKSLHRLSVRSLTRRVPSSPRSTKPAMQSDVTASAPHRSIRGSPCLPTWVLLARERPCCGASSVAVWDDVAEPRPCSSLCVSRRSSSAGVLVSRYAAPCASSTDRVLKVACSGRDVVRN